MALDAPETPAVFDEEYVPEAHVMPFDPGIVDAILTGEKQSTYRFGTKYDYLKTGDEIQIQNAVTKEVLARALVTGKRLTTFKDIPFDADAHETYRDKEHHREVLSGYYAYIGRPIADEDPLLVFDFKLLDY